MEHSCEDVLCDVRRKGVVDDQPETDSVKQRLPVLATEPFAGLLRLFQALIDCRELLGRQSVVLPRRVTDGPDLVEDLRTFSWRKRRVLARLVVGRSDCSRFAFVLPPDGLRCLQLIGPMPDDKDI